MEQQASLIATLTEEPRDGVLEALPDGVDWLEVRADLRVQELGSRRNEMKKICSELERRQKAVRLSPL